MQIFGVRMLGLDAGTGVKVLLTLAFIAALILLRIILHAVARILVQGPHRERARFWTHQGINIGSTVIFLLALASVWFDDPSRAGTIFGLIGAGVAFAMQKFITAIAGYFVILRGKTFSVGDRIVMGGVRGDVIALDFIQTTILEMGEPPPVKDGAEPAVWVMSRQFTGRIVTVSNGQIFDEPVYNYSRDFPFIFEELHVGIAYDDKYERAEEILLDVARAQTAKLEAGSAAWQQHLQDVYNLLPLNTEPRVYYRMTDNWVELALRFIAPTHNTRALKDAMYREILRRFNAEKISIASGTYAIVQMPQLKVEGLPQRQA